MPTVQIRLRAIKDGYMDGGKAFCYRGKIYDGERVEEGHDLWYSVNDEDYYKSGIDHCMRPDFLFDYFEILTGDIVANNDCDFCDCHGEEEVLVPIDKRDPLIVRRILDEVVPGDSFISINLPGDVFDELLRISEIANYKGVPELVTYLITSNIDRIKVVD